MKILALLAVLLVSCSRTDPTPPVAADPKPEAPPPIPYGRWTSPTHCLTLFENGDFELVDMDAETHGKTMVIGAAKQIPHDDGMHFDLAVARIWQGRWVSKCRKNVKSGEFIPEFHTVGVTWKPGLHQKVRIAANDGGKELDVCIEKECLTLHPDTPVVAAKWRIVGADKGFGADLSRYAADELLDLVVAEDNGIPSAGLMTKPAKPDGSGWGTVYGYNKIEPLGHDRFRMTFTADLVDPSAPPPTILGTKFDKGAKIVLELHRLAGERLEACAAGTKRCATYDRMFDSSSYDVN